MTNKKKQTVMPKVIHGYKIVDKAQGGMAVVYKGVNDAGFCRAFKAVRPDKAANNAKLCERFLKGIEILRQLDHPNIIRALDVFVNTDDETGERYTVLEMDWLDGLDLDKYVRQYAPGGMKPETVKRICLQVIEGLQYAHEKHILHLDIKPSNLFRTRDGYIKIIDFGIAKIIGDNAAMVEGAGTVTKLTETGETRFTGTLAYASPEQQVAALKLTPASDIYSFGKTLHFLLTGTNDPSVDVETEPFATIIAKCTQPNPNKRYKSFLEMKSALEGGAGEGNVCVNPNCRKTLVAGARFCPYCGTEQKEERRERPVKRVWICNDCGRSLQSIFNDDKNHFCCYCGSKNIMYKEYLSN